MCERTLYDDGNGDGGTLAVWQGTTNVLGDTNDEPVEQMLKKEGQIRY